jgi:6-pyruvoyltetrahydropterin/6-carboxytetrahydropterin synthase
LVDQAQIERAKAARAHHRHRRAPAKRERETGDCLEVAVKNSIMNYTITKSYRFEACHSLPHLPECHQCHRLHGHSYEAIIGVTGPVVGEWVQDYADISAAVKPLIDSLDHRNLNDILPCATTAENLALWMWNRLWPRLPLLSRIEIRETPTSNCILTNE